MRARLLLCCSLLLPWPALGASGGTDLGEDTGVEHAKGDGLEVIATVNFYSGSAALSERGRAILTRLVERLKAAPALHLELAGHTDDSGAERVNAVLSEQRARSVGQFLVQHGIEADRLTVIGYGPFEPVDTNDTAPGRARNRRTEVKISP